MLGELDEQKVMEEKEFLLLVLGSSVDPACVQFSKGNSRTALGAEMLRNKMERGGVWNSKLSS